MIVCTGCNKPTKAFMSYDSGEDLCRNCWSTRVSSTVEVTVLRRADGSWAALHRTTRSRIHIKDDAEQVITLIFLI